MLGRISHHVMLLVWSVYRAVSSWYNMVGTIYNATAKYRTQYKGVLEGQIFQSTLYQNGSTSTGSTGTGSVSMVGQLPAPLLVAGDMFVGFKSPLDPGMMVVLRSNEASVSSDNRCVAAVTAVT